MTCVRDLLCMYIFVCVVIQLSFLHVEPFSQGKMYKSIVSFSRWSVSGSVPGTWLRVMAAIAVTPKGDDSDSEVTNGGGDESLTDEHIGSLAELRDALGAREQEEERIAILLLGDLGWPPADIVFLPQLGYAEFRPFIDEQWGTHFPVHGGFVFFQCFVILCCKYLRMACYYFRYLQNGKRTSCDPIIRV